MAQKKNKKNTKTIPLLPLRGIVVFPNMILHFDVGRPRSIKALEEAMMEEQKIFLAAQKDPALEEPGQEDVYTIGTTAKIKQLLRLPGDTIRVLVEGLERSEILEYTSEDPYYEVKIKEHSSKKLLAKDPETEALVRLVISHFEDYAKLTNRISRDTTFSLSTVEDYSRLSDVIAANMVLKLEQKQSILSEISPKKRLEKLLDILVKEIEILEVEENINNKVRKQIDKSQREYYLREQLKAIQDELGGDGQQHDDETYEYREKILSLNLPEEAENKALKEVDRLSRMHPSSAESGVIRTYLDWVISLPWNEKTQENFDIENAERILEEDHYGLTKVKERMIEYLAISKLRNGIHGQIICLAGPPGVGKTSIVRSIAKALNRNYVRMSLGGVRDEAEIRGHRRTYVGAMPGRIITAIKQAGSKNPLILLDEIDKMSNDFRGDPAAAMLEVLDTEQNKEFRDHYLDMPFDLSDVMFITTANNKGAIPRPLLDRMEVIDISGYVEEEKVQIAIRHLIPKQVKTHGLKSREIRFDEEAVRDVINYYTREAGVRNLEREIATICRKVAKLIVSAERKSASITRNTLGNYLGTKKYLFDKANEKDETGIARGLAWTPVGGDTLSIEVNLMPGDGALELTGQLGDIMKESAKIARSYVRSIAEMIGIEKDFYRKYDMHIHVPEGAIPKDGPSAGITLATAMISALTQIPVKRNVAMTGEITLRGKVLPIGGLKEKVIAAHRAGIDTVLFPMENQRDTEEIPENVLERLTMIPVASMCQVMKHALTRFPESKDEVKPEEDNEVSQLSAQQAQNEAAVSIEQ
ncbi:MAG: endopeptidase La [Clostridiaceae bacterium]|jgi:ATP-dependent Lon protease|nr:endopeptidase La [Clostridiaceae bacterium]